MPLPQFPLVNGNRFDYSSVEIVIAGIPYRGVQSISYKHALKPKKLYGTSAMPLGRTRGQYEPGEPSMDMYKEDYEVLTTALLALGLGGYGEANFQILVSYQEIGSSLIVDTLNGCRITEDEDSHKQGDAESIVKVTLDIMELLRNGKPLANPATRLK